MRKPNKSRKSVRIWSYRHWRQSFLFSFFCKSEHKQSHADFTDGGWGWGGEGLPWAEWSTVQPADRHWGEQTQGEILPNCRKNVSPASGCDEEPTFSIQLTSSHRTALGGWSGVGGLKTAEKCLQQRKGLEEKRNSIQIKLYLWETFPMTNRWINKQA